MGSTGASGDGSGTISFHALMSHPAAMPLMMNGSPFANAWAASWVVVGALAAGLLACLVVRVLEGDVVFDWDTVTDRFRDQTRS